MEMCYILHWRDLELQDEKKVSFLLPLEKKLREFEVKCLNVSLTSAKSQ